ncbi:MAG: hypothetical protein PHQ52_02145 [Candidatus Omnitrophica bacterium]|nr:hypothetical protein [Candidatus Omnitrophota bacterium]
MDTSILLAKIFGPYFILISVGILINPYIYQKLIQDIAKSPSFIFWSGAVAFITGLLIVLFHNIWTLTWIVVITLIGWMAILKGVWFVLFPKHAEKLFERYRPGSILIKVHLLLAFLLGLWLSFMGYFAG